MIDAKIASLRLDYLKSSLLEGDVAIDPITQFDKWWQDALTAEVLEANAMSLCTIDENNFPDSRVVLLKSFNKDGLVFFTNYQSNKAKDIARSPKVQVQFFWKELERQVRIKGVAFKIAKEESEAYFKSRPKSSQIGAWASQQSQVIKNRLVLEEAEEKLNKEYINAEVPYPEHWGGYLIKPITFEFWQGRSSRLHDRLHYTLEQNGNWTLERLSP